MRIFITLAIFVIAAAGCGGGSPEPQATPVVLPTVALMRDSFIVEAHNAGYQCLALKDEIVLDHDGYGSCHVLTRVGRLVWINPGGLRQPVPCYYDTEFGRSNAIMSDINANRLDYHELATRPAGSAARDMSWIDQDSYVCPAEFIEEAIEEMAVTGGIVWGNY